MAKTKRGISKKKQRWDERLVITVMVGAALAILILLSAHISVTGKATFTEGEITGMLNTETIGLTGTGPAKCDRLCMRIGKTCILAWEDEVLVPCNQRIDGEYACACSSTPRPT